MCRGMQAWRGGGAEPCTCVYFVSKSAGAGVCACARASAQTGLDVSLYIYEQSQEGVSFQCRLLTNTGRKNSTQTRVPAQSRYC